MATLQETRFCVNQIREENILSLVQRDFLKC